MKNRSSYTLVPAISISGQQGDVNDDRNFMETFVRVLASSDPSGGGNLGPIVTREGKGKCHWIVLPVKCQADTDQSHLGY